jgi:hypothetical protein
MVCSISKHAVGVPRERDGRQPAFDWYIELRKVRVAIVQRLRVKSRGGEDATLATLVTPFGEPLHENSHPVRCTTGRVGVGVANRQMNAHVGEMIVRSQLGR